MRTITLRCGHGGGDGRPCNRVEGVFLVEGNLLTLTRWGGCPRHHDFPDSLNRVAEAMSQRWSAA